MSKISRMSYVNLGRMIDSAVGAGILDRSSGRAHLPDPFLFKMQALAERYREQQRHYAKLIAQAQMMREERDKISPMLAQLIRSIHTTFTRFRKLNKVSKGDMIEYQIPKHASQQPANRLKVWIQFGATITRIFSKQKQDARITLPPYVLTESAVDVLAEHLAKAEAIKFKLERKVRENQEAHSKLLDLRRQVVRALELVKRHLELSLYDEPKSIRKRAMAAYGMLLPDGVGKSHMLAPDMMPTAPEEPVQRQKAEEPAQPEAKDSPSPDPVEAKPKVALDKLPADFIEAITVKEKLAPPKANKLKSPAMKEREKKKARRKQARKSRRQNR